MPTGEKTKELWKDPEFRARMLERRQESRNRNGHKGSTGYKHTEDAKRRMVEARIGEKNHIWKGQKVGYDALHDWVKRWKGQPHFCEHCQRSDLRHRQYHWANKSGEYKRDLEDWLRLCSSCHQKYDAKR